MSQSSDRARTASSKPARRSQKQVQQYDDSSGNSNESDHVELRKDEYTEPSNEDKDGVHSRASTSNIHWQDSLSVVGPTASTAFPAMYINDGEDASKSDGEHRYKDQNIAADSKENSRFMPLGDKKSVTQQWSLDRKGKGVDRAVNKTPLSDGHLAAMGSRGYDTSEFYAEQTTPRLSWQKKISESRKVSSSAVRRSASASTGSNDVSWSVITESHGSRGATPSKTLNSLSPVPSCSNSGTSKNASASSNTDDAVDMHTSYPRRSTISVSPPSTDLANRRLKSSSRPRVASEAILSTSLGPLQEKSNRARGHIRPQSPSTSPTSPNHTQIANNVPFRASNQSFAAHFSSASGPSDTSPDLSSISPIQRVSISSRERESPISKGIASPIPANSVRVPRKRAQSAMLANQASVDIPSPPIPESAPPGPSFSHSVTPRRRKESNANRVLPLPANGIDNSMSSTPKQIVRLNEAPINNSDHHDHAAVPKSIANSPQQRSLPPTLPMSISALLGQSNGRHTPNLPAATSDGPSLQELLSQVDVRGALALVREVHANVSTPIGYIGATSTRRSSIQSPTLSTLGSMQPGMRPMSPDRGEDRSTPSPLPSGPSQRGSSVTGLAAPLLPGTTGATLLANHRTSLLHENGQERNSSRPTISVDNEELLPDRRKRRLSIAGLRTGSGGKGKKVREREARRHRHDLEHNNIKENPLAILERMTPAMHQYVLQAKSELETRYRPIYMALSGGNPPPNPAEIARWRYRKEEILRRNRIQIEQSLMHPNSSYAANYEGRAGHATETSLYEALRIEGHRHPIWEVYPKDYFAFANSGGAILGDEEAFDPLYTPDYAHEGLSLSRKTGKSMPTQEQALKRPPYHQQMSSDFSLPSMDSDRDLSILTGHSVNSKNGDMLQQSKNSRFGNSLHGIHSSLGSAGGPFSSIHSSKSARSASLTQDEGLPLANVPRNPHSRTRSLPPSASEEINSRYRNAVHQAADSWEQPNSEPKPSGYSPRKKMSSRIRQLTGRDIDRYAQEDSHIPFANNGSGPIHPTLRSDTERKAATHRDVKSVAHFPGTFHQSSMNNSLVNLSRILIPRKNARGENDTDGHRSSDNEEAGDASFLVSGKRRERKPNLKGSSSGGPKTKLASNGNNSAMEDLASIKASHAEPEENPWEDSIFEREPSFEAEVVDVSDTEYSKATR